MVGFFNENFCSKNGKASFVNGTWHCDCVACYTGKYCNKVNRQLCQGTVTSYFRDYRLEQLQVRSNDSLVERCTCGPLQKPCCGNDKCLGEGSYWTGNRCHCGLHRFGNRCEKLHCLNGGISEQTGRNHVCRCNDLFAGTFCEQLSCGRHGFFHHETSSCACSVYYSGKHCEYMNCQNGGTPDATNSLCRCSWHYSGPFCENSGMTRMSYLGSAGMFMAILLCVVYCKMRLAKTATRRHCARNHQTGRNISLGGASHQMEHLSNPYSHSFTYTTTTPCRGRMSPGYAEYLAARTRSLEQTIDQAIPPGQANLTLPHQLVTDPSFPAAGRGNNRSSGTTTTGEATASIDVNNLPDSAPPPSYGEANKEQPPPPYSSIFH